MNITIQHAFLPHLDPEASLRFYRDLLGFEVRQDVSYEDKRWLTVGPPGQPETAIALHPPGLDPGITEEEHAAIRSLMAKGAFAAVTLATDDVDGLFESLAAGGVDVIQKPMDQDWGVRDCAVRDPGGTMVRINQR